MATKEKAAPETSDEDWGDEIAVPCETLKLGDTATGVYLGSTWTDGQYGMTQQHHFKNPPDGKSEDDGRFAIWGATLLDEAMGRAKLGYLTRVEHTKQTRGRSHVFSVKQRGNPLVEKSELIGHAQALT